MVAIFTRQYWLCILVAVILGSVDPGLSSLTSVIVSRDFGGRIEIFAAKFFAFNLGCVIGFLFELIFLQFSLSLYIWISLIITTKGAWAISKY